MNSEFLLSTNSHKSLRALTLVELVVVLLILVILTSVALRSTEGLVSQGRFDATSRTLRSLEEAIIGDPSLRQSDGSIIVSGFVADMGRLPNTLQELTEQGALPAFSFQNDPAEDATINLGSGWRGPYLRLPLGALSIKDGFGRDFELLQADETASANNQSIAMIRSLGADNRLGDSMETPFDPDQIIIFESTPAGILRHQSTIQGTVEVFNSVSQSYEAPPFDVLVRLFEPNGLGGINVRTVTIPTGVTPNYQFNNVPIGLRIVRAYQSGGARLSAPGNLSLSPGTTATKNLLIP